jgi:diguanylate cyclase (GGDEF)-like protein
MAAAAAAEPLLLQVTGRATALLAAPFGLLSLVDDRREVFSGAVGLPGGQTSGELPRAQSLCMHVLAAGGPLRLRDLTVSSPVEDVTLLAALGLRSYLGVPVRSRDLVLGALCVADVVPREWTDGDVSTLEDMAAMVSDDLFVRVALTELTRARDAERRLAGEQAALHRVAAAVARGLPPEDVMQLVADEVAGLMHVEGLVVSFAAGGRHEVRARAAPTEDPPVGDCVQALAALRHTGEPAVVQTSGGACTAAPVTVEGQLWGALVATGTDDDPPSPACVTLMAELVAVSVANAEARARLVEMTRTDPLTGAANRRAFSERLSAELERAQRHDEPLTLAFLDVDHFKSLNDSHGHDTGDRVIRELVGRIAHQLRAGDLLARIGGDEFALLLPETDYPAATVVVDRVRKSVEQTPLAGLEVTVTIGASVLERGEATPETIYRGADQALYSAKSAGRNAVAVHRVR